MTYYNSYREFYPGVVLERLENQRINGACRSNFKTYVVLEVLPPNDLLVIEKDSPEARQKSVSIRWSRIVEAPPLTPAEHLERLGGTAKQWKGDSAKILRTLCVKHPEWGLEFVSGRLVLK